MIKIIINADDCGKNAIVNNHIRNAIELGKITSTSVMASWDDLVGAKQLYDDFGKFVSFGIHLNLTDGVPLLYNQELLDKGLYVEKDGSLLFNCSNYRQQILSHSILEGLRLELTSQIEKIRDYGIVPSHLDSHHHIHTGIAFWHLFPSLAKNNKIERFRRMRNYVDGHFGQIQRQIWTWGCQLQNKEMRTTDYFAIFEDFLPLINQGVVGDYTIELMTHPGEDLLILEEQMLQTVYCDKIFKLISYYDI